MSHKKRPNFSSVLRMGYSTLSVDVLVAVLNFNIFYVSQQKLEVNLWISLD